MVSTSIVGFSPSAAAEALTRAQCRSRSGVTPSKARAPSNTEEPSQTACVRAPMIGTFPSCQSPSNHVQVRDHSAIVPSRSQHSMTQAERRRKVKRADLIRFTRRPMAESPRTRYAGFNAPTREEESMDQRISLVTLAVDDFGSARRFFEAGLGWRPSSASTDDVAFYQTGSMALALHPRRLLAEDAGVPLEGTGATLEIGRAHV